jgi:hypothetical protein
MFQYPVFWTKSRNPVILRRLDFSKTKLIQTRMLISKQEILELAWKWLNWIEKERGRCLFWYCLYSFYFIPHSRISTEFTLSDEAFQIAVLKYCVV